MAVNPIDLQTLYVHMAQHGKDQANIRAGVQHTQELQAQKMAKDVDVKGHSVGTVASADEEELSVRPDEKRERPPQNQTSGKKKEEDKESQTTEKKPEFQDPSLGKHIDITG